MRTLMFLAAFFVATAANAQFALAVKCGWNSATAHTSDGGSVYGPYTAQSGWQAGLEADYGFRPTLWMLYSGLEADKKILTEKGEFDAKISYKPTFLTLPLGMAYKFAFAKNFALRFYAGLYGSVGVGGRYFEDEVFFTPDWPIYNKANHKISFGNGASHDLLSTNWGTQFGLGLKTTYWFELACLYNLGLSNILPNQRLDGKLYLRSVSLDLKIDIKTFAITNKK